MIVLVAGARPNYPKVAALYAAMRDMDVRLVDTGQHHDPVMASEMREDLSLPAPDASLGVGSDSHANQTAAVMIKFAKVVEEWRPAAVVVVGDVNSTVACALVTAKAWNETGRRPVLAHVEAGLRSGDRNMPEEINRIVTDCIADLLFTTEIGANKNLFLEGIAPGKVFFVGNVMVDTLFKLKAPGDREQLLLPDAPIVATIHRPSTVDRLPVLAGVVTALAVGSRLANRPLLLICHPRTLPQIMLAKAAGLLEEFPPNMEILPAMRYRSFVDLVGRASLVVTDSGGLQEETTALGVPCITLRTTTERPVTVSSGTNRVVGVEPERIVQAIRQTYEKQRPSRPLPPLWDGHAAGRIAAIIKKTVDKGRP